jgi:hypothetical protein
LYLDKNKNTQSYSGDSKKFTSKSKTVSYDKEFKVGDSSRINISANVGKTKNPMGKRELQKVEHLVLLKLLKKVEWPEGVEQLSKVLSSKAFFNLHPDIK